MSRYLRQEVQCIVDALEYADKENHVLFQRSFVELDKALTYCKLLLKLSTNKFDVYVSNTVLLEQYNSELLKLKIMCIDGACTADEYRIEESKLSEKFNIQEILIETNQIIDDMKRKLLYR